jgi:hypothetical protein
MNLRDLQYNEVVLNIGNDFVMDDYLMEFLIHK